VELNANGRVQRVGVELGDLFGGEVQVECSGLARGASA
jgi:hypothetical protein